MASDGESVFTVFTFTHNCFHFKILPDTDTQIIQSKLCFHVKYHFSRPQVTSKKFSSLLLVRQLSDLFLKGIHHLFLKRCHILFIMRGSKHIVLSCGDSVLFIIFLNLVITKFHVLFHSKPLYTLGSNLKIQNMDLSKKIKYD